MQGVMQRSRQSLLLWGFNMLQRQAAAAKRGRALLSAVLLPFRREPVSAAGVLAAWAGMVQQAAARAERGGILGRRVDMGRMRGVMLAWMDVGREREAVGQRAAAKLHWLRWLQVVWAWRGRVEALGAAAEAAEACVERAGDRAAKKVRRCCPERLLNAAASHWLPFLLTQQS